MQLTVGKFFLLVPGVYGDESGCSSRGSKRDKVCRSVSLSSAWRPTGFKPLRAAISTVRGRVQRGGGGGGGGGGGKEVCGGRATANSEHSNSDIQMLSAE